MFRKLVVSSMSTILVLLTTFSAVAQNGAEVTKGEYPDYWGLVYNPDEGLSYWFSNFSDVCGFFAGEDWGTVLEVPWMIVHRPNDEDDVWWDGKYQDRGFFFIRALMATPEEFWSDPCGVWSNPDLIFADGMIHSTTNDNDQMPQNTNRANVWGYSASGALEDFADNCKGEMIGLKWAWRGKFKDDTFVLLKQIGPELRCN